MARRVRIVFLCVLSAIAVVPVLALPRPHLRGNPREQILELEKLWRQAQIAGDVPLMEKLLSDNFIGITVTGKVVTKAQQLDRMREHALVLTRFETSDVKIKLLGGGKVAIVNALADVAGQAETQRVDGAFRYTRVYQRLPSGIWKITNFEVTRVSKAESAADLVKP